MSDVNWSDFIRWAASQCYSAVAEEALEGVAPMVETERDATIAVAAIVTNDPRRIAALKQAWLATAPPKETT